MAATPASGTSLYIFGLRSPSTTNSANCFSTISSRWGYSESRLKRIGIRSVAEGPSNSTSTSEVEEGDWEGSIEAPQGPPSLISALNVERAFRGLPITEVDYYAALELRRGCSYDEVTNGYKKKVDELMNKGLDEEQLRIEMETLKESYSILSSVQERRLYDWSLARADNPPRYSWPSQADITQSASPETPPILQEPEDVGPTRAVGYIFLGWFVLSAVLSVLLNR
ncbi:NAD(P)H-quinone oxidoreductase subunit U, chloroplastic [Linum perenne]